MYELSWMAAFEALQKILLSGNAFQNLPNLDKIVYWAEAQLPALEKEIVKDFAAFTSTDVITISAFF